MARTPAKRPLEQIWKDRASELYMRFNMLQGYDRPVLMEYVGEALRNAYEQGLAGEQFEDYILEPSTPEPAIVKHARKRPEPVVAENATPRVMRRRTTS